MTANAVFPSKRPEEKFPVQFQFGDQLQFGETISGQVVTCVVFQGTDPDPEDVLFGAPTLSGQVVSQVVQGGVGGVVYTLVCAASGSTGTIYTKSGSLAILSDPIGFTGP